MRENTRVDFSLAAGAARSAFLTYEPYYGLKEKPFSLSADPRFLYRSRAHGPTFDDLRAGIRRREGLIVLTGEPGTGKTTLCRAVLEALDRKTFCTLVPDPFVSREDLLKMLLLDFGVMSVEDLKSGRLQGASRPELSYPLYDFLRSLVPLQAYAVLIIDEAQNLSPQLLEEIRILADLEAPEKLLQLVLVGQPELRAKLKDHSMRQVDQRVSVRADLKPLDREGVGEYIAHRLDVAGGGADRVTFSADALDVIYKTTGGNPRLINLACDKALHHGHLARTFIIGPDIITRSLTELGMLESDPAPAAAAAPAPATVAMPAPPQSSMAASAPATVAPASTPAPVPVLPPLPTAASAPLVAASATALAPSAGSAHPVVARNPVVAPSPVVVPSPVVAPNTGLAPAAAATSVAAPAQVPIALVKPSRHPDPEPSDDFGLGEKFFERQRTPEDMVGDLNNPSPDLFMSASEDEPSRWGRTVLLVLGCILAPALIAFVVWWWQQKPFDSSALPTLPPRPESDLALRTATPPASLEQTAAADPSVDSFEVGVALFSGYDRASTLAVELAASGYRASTRSIESAKGRLYEVRTGPYFTREAAEADAVRIRRIPGYADARVVPPSSATP